MLVITFIKFLLCLVIWLLLTADLSAANVLFGVAIAIVFARPPREPEPLREWLLCLRKLIIVIPLAYGQAFAMIFRPHRVELIVCEKIKPHRTARLIFLDILIISFTPKSIVTRYDDEHYRLHCIQPAARQKSKKR